MKNSLHTASEMMMTFLAVTSATVAELKLEAGLNVFSHLTDASARTKN